MITSSNNTQPAPLKMVVVALVVAALVLLGFLKAAHSDNRTKVLDAGDARDLGRAPYAVGHSVEVPGSEVTVAVAAPVRELDASMVEADDGDEPSAPRRSLESWRAPEGGSLVPITWRVTQTGFTDDPTPIRIQLISGDQRVDVDTVKGGNSANGASAQSGFSRVYGFDGDLKLSDLRIEVEYDGVTQVLEPATGDVDAGLAQPLYEDSPTYDAGCRTTDDNCEFRASDPDAPIRPTYAGFEVGELVLRPHDSELGWAEEGKLWASTRILSFGGTGQDADGNTLSMTQHGPLKLRLDGEGPAQRRELRRDELIASGTMVFEVDADSPPKELQIRSWYQLSNGTRLPIVRTLELKER